MNRLLYIIIIVLLGGCMPPFLPSEEIYQRVAKQVELLVDSGYLTMPYVEIYEIVSNDSSVVYYIGSADSPASRCAELPSRVIKYKDRFLCFIELDEPEISRTELLRQEVVADSMFRESLYMGNTCHWLFACRKYEKRQVLVRFDEPQTIGLTDVPYETIFDHPELWPYFSGGRPYGKSSLMVLDSHNIIVAEPYWPILYGLEADSLKQYIDRFSGKIFLRNQTDSSLVVSCDSVGKRHYAIVNGSDTLGLCLRNSLPIVIKPHEYINLEYDSECPHSFLRKLPEQDVWMSMYQLFCDSTFCFLNVNGTPQKCRIMHDDTQWRGWIEKDPTLGVIGIEFFNKNVADKNERNRRFFSVFP